MRYITDDNNYITFLSFTAEIECESGTCTEYTGDVPAGYDSLEAWYLDNVSGDCFASWQIIDGQLVQAEEPRLITPDRKPNDPNIHPATSISFDNTNSELQLTGEPAEDGVPAEPVPVDNVQTAIDAICAKTVTMEEEVDYQLTQMQSSIEQNAEAIAQRVKKTEVDNILLDYPTKTQTESLINQSAEGLELSVTQSVMQGVEDTVASEVSANLGLYVKKDENDQVVSMLEASANEINITGNRISIDSNDFTLTAEGSIEATAGTIGGWTIGNTSLYTNEGQGATIDASEGSFTTGALKILASSTNVASFTLDGVNMVFQDTASVQSITLCANGNGQVVANAPATFNKDVTFKTMPSFPDYIPVSEGGTGKGTFTKNAVLIGNGSSALKAVSTFAGVLQCDSEGGLPYFAPLESSGGGGTIGGQTSITLSTSAVEKTVSLSGANSYYIVASPNINTGNPINWTVCNRTATGFKIKCAPNSALNGTSVGFDWIAIPM